MSTALAIPDLVSATDEQIEAILPSFDGRWSAQTKALLALHATDRLNLDDNWASVPQAWRCHACGRHKRDLARKSPAGVLICRLDWHHDHLRDFGKRLLRDKAHRPAEPEAFRRWFGATDACKDLIERFHPSFVCVDCNAADGDAKRRLKGVVHPDFSFAPSEIAQFITARPNLPHEVDLDVALGVWRSVEDDVRDRIAFVGILAKRVSEGRHQRLGRKIHPEDCLRPVLRDLTRRQPNPGLTLARVPQILSERSIQNDGFRSSLKARAKPVRVPTRADLDAFTASQDSRSPWVWHDPEWRCPACDRSRFECLRASGSGKWTGRLHCFHVYEDETDPVALTRRNGWHEGLTFRSHSDVYLCQDCRLVITDTNRGLAEPSDDCLRLADLRGLAGKAAPHVRPEVDLDRAAAMAEENFEHIEAAKAYWRHKSDCQGIAIEYSHLTGWVGVSRETAMWNVLERLRRYDLDEDELGLLLDFMLEEAKRFSAEDEARPRRPWAGTAAA